MMLISVDGKALHDMTGRSLVILDATIHIQDSSGFRSVVKQFDSAEEAQSALWSIIYERRQGYEIIEI